MFMCIVQSDTFCQPDGRRRQARAHSVEQRQDCRKVQGLLHIVGLGGEGNLRRVEDCAGDAELPGDPRKLHEHSVLSGCHDSIYRLV